MSRSVQKQPVWREHPASERSTARDPPAIPSKQAPASKPSSTHPSWSKPRRVIARVDQPQGTHHLHRHQSLGLAAQQHFYEKGLIPPGQPRTTSRPRKAHLAADRTRAQKPAKSNATDATCPLLAFWWTLPRPVQSVSRGRAAFDTLRLHLLSSLHHRREETTSSVTCRRLFPQGLLRFLFKPRPQNPPDAKRPANPKSQLQWTNKPKQPSGLTARTPKEKKKKKNARKKKKMWARPFIIRIARRRSKSNLVNNGVK